uniref:GPI-anchored wall transfer protein 1 n=1 Tax=Kwoniella bestiolae CBS 10118 TaxID=1296100 RepID=A0A1B9FWK9_9TREE|nr:hypothetical protein I302_07515 [Kwoniella bestiolae CBS 10118]OCF23162.1 hypothetical protein I302_07515 [Kwoniella bestiolae CBS 10118]
MSDYKAAKEAFVSDNPGSSIYTILAVSLVAWISYALYATLYPRIKPSFISDYLTSSLPLLLGVTLFATIPITYNIFLLTLSSVVYLLSPKSRRRQIGNTSKDQSKGSWLEESDSDEEIAEPTSTTTSAQNTPIKLPSQVALSSAHEYSASPSPSILSNSSNPTSPSNLSVDDPFTSVGVNKRRLKSDSLPGSSTYPTKDRSRTRNVSTPSTIRLGKGDGEGQKKRRLPFLSVYRAHMMIMTVHCILAVDFQVFPRWLGKCEDFGTSLMDVGVGSFVFSLGLISLKSLNPEIPSSSINPPSSPGLTLRKDTAHTLPKDLLKALRKSLPTLILGFIRLVMVKGVEYPEHVTEYGVHWNFFFTIGLLPVFGVLVRPLRRRVSWRLLGIGISLVQQAILTRYGLQSYLLSPSREGIMGQNKEGLSSLPGYIAIYLLGLSIGENISKLEVSTPPTKGVTDSHVHEDEQSKRQYEKRRTELILQLFGHSVVYWGTLGGWSWVNGDGDARVSRRFANTPYVLFIASYNTLFLLGYLLLESTFPDIPTPALLESINRNGLVVFLVANLGTGLVNVCMDSMYAGRVVSMGVLGMYSLGVCGVAWAIRGRRIGI